MSQAAVPIKRRRKCPTPEVMIVKREVDKTSDRDTTAHDDVEIKDEEVQPDEEIPQSVSDGPFHVVGLASRQLEALESGFLTDVTILVRDEAIKCHSVIVSFASPKLAAILKEKTLQLPDVDPHYFRILLQIIYTGKPSQPPDVETLLQVGHLAHELQVHVAVVFCAKRLARKVNTENLWRIIDFGNLIDDTEFVKTCCKTIHVETGSILQTEGFLKCTRNTLEVILEQDKFYTVTELQLFQACVAWADAKSTGETESTSEIESIDEAESTGQAGIVSTDAADRESTHQAESTDTAANASSGQAGIVSTDAADHESTHQAEPTDTAANGSSGQANIISTDAADRESTHQAESTDTAANESSGHADNASTGEAESIVETESNGVAEKRRAVLGSALRSIRFRLFSAEEFAEHVCPTGLLSAEVERDIFRSLVTGENFMPEGFSESLCPRGYGDIMAIKFRSGSARMILNKFAENVRKRTSLVFTVNRNIFMLEIRLRSWRLNVRDHCYYEEDVTVSLHEKVIGRNLLEKVRYRGNVRNGDMFYLTFERPYQLSRFVIYALHLNYTQSQSCAENLSYECYKADTIMCKAGLEFRTFDEFLAPSDLQIVFAEKTHCSQQNE